MRSLLHLTRWASGTAVLAAILLVAFVGLVASDIHCQYRSLSQSQHEHHEGPQDPTSPDMAHCLYAHQAASSVMASFSLISLDTLRVTAFHSLYAPVTRPADFVVSLAARAPPAV